MKWKKLTANKSIYVCMNGDCQGKLKCVNQRKEMSWHSFIRTTTAQNQPTDLHSID